MFSLDQVEFEFRLSPISLANNQAPLTSLAQVSSQSATMYTYTFEGSSLFNLIIVESARELVRCLPALESKFIQLVLIYVLPIDSQLDMRLWLAQ